MHLLKLILKTVNLHILFCVLCYLGGIVASDIKGFDDSVHFKINWPGNEGIDFLDDKQSGQEMLVTNHAKEKYRCILPTVEEKEENSEEVYSGANPLELLAPIFLQFSCSYRLESYWTYEVCHGRYVRQFHEEKDGKKVKLQEYYLGRWDKPTQLLLHEALEREKEAGYPTPLLTKKIDGVNLPYLQMNMTDGTICDLNGSPRQANVLYVCYASGKHEVYSFKETSTCVYELVVLSSMLCQHPKYKPLESGEHVINCLPLEDSPKKPKSLLKLEVENLKMRHRALLGQNVQKMKAVFSIRKDEDGHSRVQIELQPFDAEESSDAEALSTLSNLPKHPATPELENRSPVKKFLAGEECIQGGSGWWKYEFCFGRHVEQFHVGKDGVRTAVRLGMFEASKHREWLQNNPHKRPKPAASRTHISHFYGSGDLCDKTGRSRETEVKLKCVESKQAESVALYLLEPHTCQYILGVESQMVCSLLNEVDEDGLMPKAEELKATTASSDEIEVEEVDERDEF